MTEKSRFLVVHTTIAIAIAVVIFLPALALSTFCLNVYFSGLYPHDGQNALGAFFFAIPIAGLTAFIAAMFSVFLSVRRSLKKFGNAGIDTEN